MQSHLGRYVELCVAVSHLILLSDHVLGHLKGAEVLVHVLDVRVVCGVLASVQQPLDGSAVVVDDVALVLNFIP